METLIIAIIFCCFAGIPLAILGIVHTCATGNRIN